MTYTAYLRIYEPVPVFHEPERSRWGACAGSADRPGGRDPLSATAAVAGLAKGQCQLAIAMYQRVHSQWRAFTELELAN